MTFREHFDRYRDGTATDEERRMVDEELEKAALINEHLFGSWEETPADPPARELKYVRKSLRRRNITLVLTSVVLVIALLLSIPLAERMYFDPTLHTTSSTTMTDLELALWCYYDLLAPDQIFSCISSCTDTGFGTWSLEVCYLDWDSPSYHSYRTAVLDKNEIHFPRNTLFYSPTDLFNFGSIQIGTDSADYHSIQEIEWQLADVEEDASVYVAVSFNGDLTAAELFDLMDRYDFVIRWAGVRAGHPSDPLEPLIGMHLDSHRQDDGINADYPDLIGPVTEYNAELHFHSMVEYCRGYTAQTMDLGIIEDSAYYDTVLNELDENGLRFYGAYFTASVEVFRDLAADGHITDFRLLEDREPGGMIYLAPSFGG